MSDAAALAALSLALAAHGVRQIDSHDGNATPAAVVRREHVVAAKPCVLRGAAAHWRACREWCDGSGRALPGALSAALGKDTLVPVDADDAGAAYGCAARRSMTVGAFEGLVASGARAYLKDFHYSPASAPYDVPRWAADDALNPYLDAVGAPPFRFLYAGSAGTLTPLHHDVVCSHSWSANVSGHKLWMLVDPCADGALYSTGGRFGGSLCASDLRCPALVRATDACIAALAAGEEGTSGSGAAAAMAGVSKEELVDDAVGVASSVAGALFAVVQAPGDVVFVPSGWHHSVVNLGPGIVISINHNWLSTSGPCLARAADFLVLELEEVRTRLSDCRPLASSDEWRILCQRMLATDAGFDVPGFSALLTRRRETLQRAIKEGLCVTDEDEGTCASSGTRESGVLPRCEGGCNALPESLALDGIASIDCALEKLRAASVVHG